MALDSPLRWDIISGIGREAKATSEIREALAGIGRRLSRSGLYYHLSALESAGIIERASYREIGGGAPEKVWRVKVPKITVEILKPE